MKLKRFNENFKEDYFSIINKIDETLEKFLNQNPKYDFDKYTSAFDLTKNTIIQSFNYKGKN